MRGHAEDRADGQHPGPADAGDGDVPGPLSHLGQDRIGKVRGIGGGGGGAAGHRARERHEGGAEALETAQILVAGTLIDAAAAAPFGLQRFHGDAVRLHRTVAAALADLGVDPDAQIRVGQRAALAPPALLGRAGLDIDQDRHARHLAQLLLERIEAVAPLDGHAGGSGPVTAAGSSATMRIAATPSAASIRATCAGSSGPSTACPPVIATASL